MTRWSDLAEWVGPTPNQGGAMSEYRGLVLHIMEGSYEGSIQWGKNPTSDVSFHFATAKDGRLGQLVDTGVVAWTQVSGNGHWISVENEGYPGDALTAGQIEACAQIYARGVRDYGWPMATTDDPNGRGLGWHGMGGAAWGGHTSCPGEPVKAQRPAILARAQQILAGIAGAQSTVEDDMATIVQIGNDYYEIGAGVRRRLACKSPNGINDVGYVASGKWGQPAGQDAPRPGLLPYTNKPIDHAPWIDIPKVPVGVLDLVDDPAPAAVDAETVAATLIANHDFAALLKAQAFAGAQEAETK